MKEILEMKRTHDRIVTKRKAREAELKGAKGRVPPPPARDYPLTKQDKTKKRAMF